METYQFKLAEIPRIKDSLVSPFKNSFCLNLKLMTYIEDGIFDSTYKNNLIFLNESTNEFIHFQLGKISSFLEINEKVERIFKSQIDHNNFTVWFETYILYIYQI
jgi:hypothetical protein